MEESKKSQTTKWEVSIIELMEGKNLCFKVTKIIPGLKVAETRVFGTKGEALRQFNEWLE
ncbi:hypothetical protein HYU14_07625 [Candidatus Woesearchaeota archaeon]|nr:hypothetical protein [Candidatus Woesearchaeota archaeon]